MPGDNAGPLEDPVPKSSWKMGSPLLPSQNPSWADMWEEKRNTREKNNIRIFSNVQIANQQQFL